MERKLFICSCDNIEHQMIFSYFDDDEYPEVYVDIHLVPESNVFRRIWYAIKYIFGYKCRYGDFDEFIFNKEDAQKLQSIVDYLKQCK